MFSHSNSSSFCECRDVRRNCALYLTPSDRSKAFNVSFPKYPRFHGQQRQTTTGVDLLNILGETKILGREQRVGKLMNAWAFLKYWGHMPGLPPKSTPMQRAIVHVFVPIVFFFNLFRM